MEESTKTATRFARNVLPWAVLAAALAAYSLTLNHWVNFNCLGTAAQLAGWHWQIEYLNPLHYLLTYPLRWLPVAGQPIGLNIFGMVCAALSLALLARSVALLPQDRTMEQRNRLDDIIGILMVRGNWLPPLLAVLALGLQQTFWQNATAESIDTLDVLLFAYVIRCLLEYRMEENRQWLYKMALVYGLAVTNNWAMISFFPLFLAATIALLGREFFRQKFILTMLGYGTAGLLLYLFLPLTQMDSTHEGATFWMLLKANWSLQKAALFYHPARFPVFALSLTSLVPLALASIKWPASEGDVNPVANVITVAVLRLIPLAFLLSGLWMIIQPPYQRRIDESGLQYLMLYYLTALSIGYCAGHVMLVFGKAPARFRSRPWPIVESTGRVVLLCLWVVLIVVPVVLVMRNLPRVQARNGVELKRYARRMAEALPPTGAVVLADDSWRLYLPALYYGSPRQCPHLFVYTAFLDRGDYHRRLTDNSEHPNIWPALPPAKDGGPLLDPVDPMVNIRGLVEVSLTHPIYYLHPSFGYFFEWFYPEAHGLVYRLQRYPGTEIGPMAKTPPANLAENLKFWQQVQEESGPTLARARAYRLRESELLADWYSRGLDTFGVELQRNNQLDNANWAFSRALDFGPQNKVAAINLEYNKNLRAGVPVPLKEIPALWDGFEVRGVQNILNTYGPIDEPTYCYELGILLGEQNRNYRQAIQLLQRARDAHPDNIQADIALATIYGQAQMFDRVLAVVAQAKAGGNRRWQETISRIELIRLEAAARFARNMNDDKVIADRLLQDLLRQEGKNEYALGTIARMDMSRGRLTNALEIVDRWLQVNPKNEDALLNKGLLCIQTGQFPQATNVLSRLLAINSDHVTARLKRADAFALCGNLEAAHDDYKSLIYSYPKEPLYHYSLAEIAYRQKDTNLAIVEYEEVLKLVSSRNSSGAKAVEARLKELHGGP